MKALLRPVCWLVGHPWESRRLAYGTLKGQWRSFWYCDRCGLEKRVMPKEVANRG